MSQSVANLKPATFTQFNELWKAADQKHRSAVTGDDPTVRVRDAAQAAGKVAVLAERGLHEAIEAKQPADVVKRWVDGLGRASEKAARLYDDSATRMQGAGRAIDSLYSTKFWELAVSVAGSKPSRDAFEHSLEKAKFMFDADVSMLNDAEREAVTMIEIGLELGMERLNRPEAYQRVLYDGLLVEAIVERGMERERFENCQRVAPALAARAMGVDIDTVGEAGDKGVDQASKNSNEICEKFYGATYVDTTPELAAEALRAAGEGAVGLISIQRRPGKDVDTGEIREGGGHVAAVCMKRGIPVYLEGQLDGVQKLQGAQLRGEWPTTTYQLLIIRDPSKGIVPVDEKRRYHEIRNALDDNDQWRERPPQSLRRGLIQFAKSGFEGSPLAKQLDAARAIGAAIEGTAPRSTERAAVFAKLGVNPQRIGASMTINQRRAPIPIDLAPNQSLVVINDTAKANAVSLHTTVFNQRMAVEASGKAVDMNPENSEELATTIDLEGVDLDRVIREAESLTVDRAPELANAGRSTRQTRAAFDSL